MNRRKFMVAAIALGLFGCAPAATEAAPFVPSRFSVQVQGTGPDVILIPGLTAGRDVWQATARAVPLLRLPWRSGAYSETRRVDVCRARGSSAALRYGLIFPARRLP